MHNMLYVYYMPETGVLCTWNYRDEERYVIYTYRGYNNTYIAEKFSYIVLVHNVHRI